MDTTPVDPEDSVDSVISENKPSGKRLTAAMAAYAVIIGIAFWILKGRFLAAVLILIGGLASKTVIAAKRPQ